MLKSIIKPYLFLLFLSESPATDNLPVDSIVPGNNFHDDVDDHSTTSSKVESDIFFVITPSSIENIDLNLKKHLHLKNTPKLQHSRKEKKSKKKINSRGL